MKNWEKKKSDKSGIANRIVNSNCHLGEVLDEYFHHNVLELDVHHGGHRLLLRAHQRGPKDNSQVGHGHQVELTLSGNAAGTADTAQSEITSFHNANAYSTTSANHVGAPQKEATSLETRTSARRPEMVTTI